MCKKVAWPSKTTVMTKRANMGLQPKFMILGHLLSFNLNFHKNVAKLPANHFCEIS